jgi:CTP-dependent riboflavin kinase
MPGYIGDGQAWACHLRGEKFPQAIECWVFRRIGSQAPASVIEIVASEPLRAPYNLQHGDPVVIEIFSPES